MLSLGRVGGGEVADLRGVIDEGVGVGVEQQRRTIIELLGRGEVDAGGGHPLGRRLQPGERGGGRRVGRDDYGVALHLLTAGQRDADRALVRLDDALDACLQPDRARWQMRRELRGDLAHAALRDERSCRWRAS